MGGSSSFSIVVIVELATGSPAPTRKSSMLPASSGVSILLASAAVTHRPFFRCSWTHATVLVRTNIPVSDVPDTRSLLLTIVLVVRFPISQGAVP